MDALFMGSNTINNINNDVYQSSITLFKQHSNDEYKLIGEVESTERSRRIEDVTGEQIRKANAHKISEMFAFHTRPIWFLEGSAHFFDLVGLAKESGNNLLHYAQIKTSKLTSQFSDYAGRKGYELSQSTRHNLDVVGEKAITTAHTVKERAEDKAFQVTAAISDKAGEMSVDAVNVLSHKLDTAAHKVGVVANRGIHKTSVVAVETSHTAKDVMQEQLNNVNLVAHQAALKVRSTSSNMLGKLNNAVTKLTYNTHMAYFGLQLENERAFRMNSESEVYAVLNALMVSSLIKNLGPAFYRPTSEPSRLYATRLLESYERVSRVNTDLVGPAKKNAKQVADIIQYKFDHPAPVIRTGPLLITPTALKTFEQRTSSPSPSMVMAKSQMLSEIIATVEPRSPMGAAM